MELNEKVILVTGSSKGLGMALCKNLIEAGAQVIGWSRSASDISHPNFTGQRVDISNETEVKHFSAQLLDKCGRIDGLINNAGFGDYRPVEESDSAMMRQMFETNVYGPFYLIKEFLPAMKKAKSGHIVNVSSIAGITGIENMSVYNATKFAVKGMSESLYRELRKFGIKVTCILPGSIETEFFDSFENFTSSSNKMQAHEVAETIIQLMRSSSSMHPINIELRPFQS